MITCPHFHNTKNQIKIGTTKAGSQCYRCKDCQRSYTPDPKQQGYPDHLRQQAVRMYVDGMNLRRIARHLGMYHKLVSNWGNAHSAQLPDAPFQTRSITPNWTSCIPLLGQKTESI